ncbi:MAG: DUF2971 domain-containing protein [Rhodospirillaceae bacterium]|nr:DUF2971 domain-containing protein [Rhodospirillaceae bacterium]
MERETKQPTRLYKYRTLTARTLDMVVGDKLHFADPSAFNDPLDTQPSLENDVGVGDLRRILWALTAQRIAAEMWAAADAMKLRGSKTTDLIKKRSRGQADKLIADIEYSSMGPESGTEETLRHWIECELLRRYGKGIVSLAERDDCPLMWSHYGDQHRGICLGYSVPKQTEGYLHRVTYDGARLVKASAVSAMLDGDSKAHARVDAAVMLRKAESWSYEREWRLVGSRGTKSSSLRLEEIVFGMKCKDSVKYTVMKALNGRSAPVEFHQIREKRGAFDLRKEALTYDDELFVQFPLRHMDLLEAFEDLTVGDATSGEE